jgi:hypothetical protein
MISFYRSKLHFDLDWSIYIARYMLNNAAKQRAIYEEVSPWYIELLKLRAQSHGLPSLTASTHHIIITF